MQVAQTSCTSSEGRGAEVCSSRSEADQTAMSTTKRLRLCMDSRMPSTAEISSCLCVLAHPAPADWAGRTALGGGMAAHCGQGLAWSARAQSGAHPGPKMIRLDTADSNCRAMPALPTLSGTSSNLDICSSHLVTWVGKFHKRLGQLKA